MVFLIYPCLQQKYLSEKHNRRPSKIQSGNRLFLQHHYSTVKALNFSREKEHPFHTNGGARTPTGAFSETVCTTLPTSYEVSRVKISSMPCAFTNKQSQNSLRSKFFKFICLYLSLYTYIYISTSCCLGLHPCVYRQTMEQIN